MSCDARMFRQSELFSLDCRRNTRIDTQKLPRQLAGQFAHPEATNQRIMLALSTLAPAAKL